MDVIVRYNSVYLKNASLGKSFGNMVADLIVDKYGKVKIIKSKLSFYTDLDCLPFEMLNVISERLEKEGSNRILTRIKEKVSSNMHTKEKEN